MARTCGMLVSLSAILTLVRVKTRHQPCRGTLLPSVTNTLALPAFTGRLPVAPPSRKCSTAITVTISAGVHHSVNMSSLVVPGLTAVQGLTCITTCHARTQMEVEGKRMTRYLPCRPAPPAPGRRRLDAPGRSPSGSCPSSRSEVTHNITETLVTLHREYAQNDDMYYVYV